MTKENFTKSQRQKFEEAARELETDQYEPSFDALVKRIAKTPPAKGKTDAGTKPEKA